jgi:hypothetical protein
MKLQFLIFILAASWSLSAHARTFKWARLNAPDHPLHGQILCFGERSTGSHTYDIYHDHYCNGMVRSPGTPITRAQIGKQPPGKKIP